MARLGQTAPRCPVDDLRSAVGKLRYDNVFFVLGLEGLAKAEFRTERVVKANRAKRLP